MITSNFVYNETPRNFDINNVQEIWIQPFSAPTLLTWNNFNPSMDW